MNSGPCSVKFVASFTKARCSTGVEVNPNLESVRKSGPLCPDITGGLVLLNSTSGQNEGCTFDESLV